MRWSVDDPDFPLAQLSLSPVESALVFDSTDGARQGSQEFLFSLVLLPGAFSSSPRLLFSLSCELDNGFSASASVSVRVNAPPLPGRFSCSPSIGESLKTLFTFTAFQWTDTDLPLSYEFGYLTA